MIAIASFGEKLRVEREKQGYTLAQVSQETKIRQHYLSALEEEAFESLPARVYAIGFVASYARFLKLDADRLVGEFKNLAYSNEPVEPPPVEPVPGKVLGFPVRNVLAAVVFLAVVLWLGNYVAGYIAHRGITTPPPVEQTNPPNPGSPSTPAELTLAITAGQRSWVQVSTDGTVQYVGLMEAGEVKSFTAKDQLGLRTGNAGGIQLQLNGKPLPSLGAPGQVADKTFTRSDTEVDSPAATMGPVTPSTAALNLEVKALQRSWVQVKVDGQLAYSQNMAEGDLRTFTAVERIELKTGNAGGIALTLNGQPVESLGSSGQIAEKIFHVDDLDQ
ncbi:MAG: RodZ domain-containing protein [Syntrophomonadaceae bacterium]